MAEYTVIGKFLITERGSGKVITRELNTTYNSGGQPANEERIIRKCLKKALSDIALLAKVEQS
jgi:hypothetical protein